MTQDQPTWQDGAVARSYVRSRRLGIALREYREAAPRPDRTDGVTGYTLEEVAVEIATSPATVSKVERARTVSRPAMVRLMLQLYGAPDSEVERWVQVAKDARSKAEWWRPYNLPGRLADLAGLESEAISIAVYDTNFVPGLAQTEAYCRAVVEATQVVELPDKTMDELISFRMRRQRRILDDPDAPQVSIIVDDSVLDRAIGGNETMTEQIDHLIMIGERANITVQVIEVAAGAHPGLPGSATLLEFNDLMPSTVYIDTVPGDLLLDSKDAVQDTKQKLNAVRARAATPEASRDMLRAARK